MNGLGLGALLLAIWLLLWGELSVANVLSGVAVVADHHLAGGRRRTAPRAAHAAPGRHRPGSSPPWSSGWYGRTSC